MKIEKAKRPDGKKLLRKWTKMFPKIEGTLTVQTNKQTNKPTKYLVK